MTEFTELGPRLEIVRSSMIKDIFKRLIESIVRKILDRDWIPAFSLDPHRSLTINREAPPIVDYHLDEPEEAMNHKKLLKTRQPRESIFLGKIVHSIEDAQPNGRIKLADRDNKRLSADFWRTYQIKSSPSTRKKSLP